MGIRGPRTGRAGEIALAHCIVVLAGATGVAAAREIRLLGPDGRPAAGVVAWVSSPGALDKVAADPIDGTLRLPDAGVEAACASAAGLQPVDLLGAEGSEITMRGGEPLAGSVVTAGARTPVHGAVVMLRGDEALGPCSRRATVDSEGHWLLSGLPNEKVTIDIVQAPGHLAPPPQEARSGAGRRLDVVLHRSCVITLSVAGVSVTGPSVAGPSVAGVPATGQSVAGGSAASSEAAPLPGVPVRIVPEWRRQALDPPQWPELIEAVEAWTGMTDATGGVTLPPLPWRAGWRIVAEHPALAPASVMVPADAAARSASLTLRAGAALALRAVGENQAPLPGASARVVPVEGADLDLAPASTTSGADGIVWLARLPPGRFALEVAAPGMTPGAVRGLSAEHGATLEIGDVVLRPGLTLVGRVTSDGDPIASATIQVRGIGATGRFHRSAETSGQGAYRFDGLERDSPLRLDVSAPGHRDERRELAAGTTEADVAMRAVRTLRVEVRDAVLGELLADAGARLTAEEGWPHFDAEAGGGADEAPGTSADLAAGGAGGSATAAGGADAAAQDAGSGEGARDVGTAQAAQDARDAQLLRIAGVPDGTYELTAWAPGHALAARAGIVIDAGGPGSIAIDLPRARSLDGLVVDAATRGPIEGARVSGPHPAPVITAPDGGFVLDGIVGPFRMRAEHDAHLEVSQNVDPDALPAGGLVVVMEAGGSAEGIVVDAEGRPLQGAVISGGGSGRAVTDAEGYYRLDGLKPGLAQIVKTDRPMSLEGREAARVEIVAGRVTRCDFGMAGRLRGRVSRADEPLAGATLGLQKVPRQGEADTRLQPHAAATTDAEGRYELTGVVPGLHVLQVTWGLLQVARDVVMPEGVRELAHDVEIPEFHVSGHVVDAETRAPLGGVQVALQLDVNDDRHHLISSMQSSDGHGEIVMLGLTTQQGSRTRTAADGSFRLPVPQPGPVSVNAQRDGYESARVELDLAGSRDGVLLELKPKEAAGPKLRVRLVDAASGTPIAGSIGWWGDRAAGSSSGSGRLDTSLDLDALPLSIAGWAGSYGIAQASVTAEDAEQGDVTRELRLSAGGSVRLLVPDGVLDGPLACGEDAPLGVTLASGFDILRGRADFCHNVGLRLATPSADGALTIADLPPGPVTISVEGLPPRTVDVIARDVVELDLR